MRFLPFAGVLFAAASLGLVACNASQDATLAKLCAYDAQLQPVAAAVVSTVPNAAPIVTVDSTVIHPAVVAACGSLVKPQ